MRVASPWLACLLSACAVRATSRTPRRESSVAPRPVDVAARDVADAREAAAPLRRAEQLPVPDGAEVTVCGVVQRFVPGPRGVTTAWWAGLRLEGDERPRVYFDPPAGFDARDGERACATGRYFREEPARPGDPPYASRRRGSWLVEPRDVRLEAVDAR